MIKNTSKLSNISSNSNNQTILEVKSKYDAEFRRFGLNKQKLAKFDDFYKFLERLHGLFDIQFIICYTDRDGELLPINNDSNFNRVLNITVGILRLIIQRKGECYDISQLAGSGAFLNSGNGGGGSSNVQTGHYNSSSKTNKNLVHQIKNLRELTHNAPLKPLISYPEDFRPVSAIIDVDILPETYRRVRLHKHKSSKPLGFYIRDGRSIRVTPNGVEQVPSIFISRLMPGGLAESTGLLSVNDEVIEVNGIEVAGKTLDQVTDMMIANSSNLIITVKPANQRYNLNRTQQNLNDSRLNNQTIPSIKSTQNPSISGASSISSNSSFANSFNKTTTTSSHHHIKAPVSGGSSSSSNTTIPPVINNTNHLSVVADAINNNTSSLNVLNGGGNVSVSGGGISNSNTNLRSNTTTTSGAVTSDDDDDDDEEVHDANNDDKILTL